MNEEKQQLKTTTRTEILGLVNECIEKEFDLSMQIFPLFNSPHEGYAVMLEEIEEVNSEMGELYENFQHFWDLIRADKKVEALEKVEQIKSSAMLSIIELVQVAAMCKKFEESQNE